MRTFIYSVAPLRQPWRSAGVSAAFAQGQIIIQQHQRSGRRLQRSDAGGAGRRQPRRDARPAAPQRVRVVAAQHLGRACCSRRSTSSSTRSSRRSAPTCWARPARRSSSTTSPAPSIRTRGTTRRLRITWRASDLEPGTSRTSSRTSRARLPFLLRLRQQRWRADVDLLPVVLHELGHGLGFSNFVDGHRRAQLADGKADIYSQYTLDVTTGKIWNAMTNAERAALGDQRAQGLVERHQRDEGRPEGARRSASRSFRNNTAGGQLLMIGTAAFGPALTAAGITGDVVVGLDVRRFAGTSPSTTDACSPLTNDADRQDRARRSRHVRLHRSR